MTFQRRKIDIEITLGSGDFGEGTGNTATLTGYRVSAQIVKGGGPSADSATIRVFGVPISLINQLTRYGCQVDAVRRNTVIVRAGDDAAGMSQVFAGTLIPPVYGDFGSPPDTVLTMTALGAGILIARPSGVLSFPDTTPVATIMAQLAGNMGYGFTNFGVESSLPSSYYTGTAYDQMRAIAHDANINAVADEAFQTLAIWPKGKARGELGPRIGPDSGLVGYPRYSDIGIAITAEYRPGLLFGMDFTLDSTLEPARGVWNIQYLSYDLESETPGGAWFVDIEGQRFVNVGSGV